MCALTRTLAHIVASGRGIHGASLDVAVTASAMQRQSRYAGYRYALPFLSFEISRSAGKERREDARPIASAQRILFIF